MSEPDRRRLGEQRNATERAIIEVARTHPELGQARVAAELGRRGLIVSASGVRNIWQRHDLETAYKRIKAIAGAPRKTGGESLTHNQARRLERGAVNERHDRALRRKTPSVAVDAEHRRHQILAAAADCFARDGYLGASLRDIARKVGLLPGSIYHHFPTKDDLFLAVHEQGFVELIGNVEKAAALGKDPWDRLERACAAHIEALVAGDQILRLTGASFFSSYPAAMVRRLKPDRDRYDAIFKVLVSELNLPRRIDRSLFRLTLLGAINWPHVWFRKGKDVPSLIAKKIIEIVRPT